MKHIKKSKTEHKIGLLKCGKIVAYALSFLSLAAAPITLLWGAIQAAHGKAEPILIAPFVPLISSVLSTAAGVVLGAKEKALKNEDKPEQVIQHNESEFVDYKQIGYVTDRNLVLGGFTDNGFEDYTDMNGNPIFTENNLPDAECLTI